MAYYYTFTHTAGSERFYRSAEDPDAMQIKVSLPFVNIIIIFESFQ